MNRYGATAAAIGLLLTLGACGGSDQPASASNQTPIVPSTPVTAPTVTPTVDPTTAAKTKVLADYANYFTYMTKGLRYGGVTYPYEQVMTGAALTALKNNMAVVRGVQGGKVTGSSRLLESRVSDLKLTGKPPTATVTACAIDNFTVTDKHGKVTVKPPGKVTQLDKLMLVKGRWMVYSTETGDPSYGCTK